MKTVILLLSLAAMAYAQYDRVQVVDHPDQVRVVDQPGGSNVIDSAFYRPTNQRPSTGQGFQRPSIGPTFVIPNPDPYFGQPHGGNNIIDPGYYLPHAPGNGYESISTGPAYVDNSQYGGLRPTRPGQQYKYPPFARGGN